MNNTESMYVILSYIERARRKTLLSPEFMLILYSHSVADDITTVEGEIELDYYEGMEIRRMFEPDYPGYRVPNKIPAVAWDYAIDKLDKVPL